LNCKYFTIRGHFLRQELNRTPNVEVSDTTGA